MTKTQWEITHQGLEMNNTIEINISGQFNTGKSRLTAMIHEMIEREFPNVKVNVNDQDGPEVYRTIRDKLPELKNLPLPVESILINNDTARRIVYVSDGPETPEVFDPDVSYEKHLGIPNGEGDPYLAGIVSRQHDHGPAANDDQENPE